MAASSLLLTHAEQSERCFFCGEPLADLGTAFLDHVDATVACRDRHEAWMSHLDEDRPGG
jgi:DNA-directed RNA polymerase subunit N (RpoN/RPB10)